MDSRFASLKCLLLLTGAVAMVSYAQAQALMKPGQAIIFSAPDNGDATLHLTVPAPQPPAAPGFADMIRAPEFNFTAPSTAATRLPVPQQTMAVPAQDPRANWALMTPAEILGVATPEQILKIPQRDAAGQRKNMTVVERYYERQDQAQTNRSGGFLPGAPSLRPDFSDNEYGRMNANGFNPAGGDFGNPAQPVDASFQQPATGNGPVAGQNGNVGWSKIFISPPAPVQSPAQAADMAEFRKLLEPDQPPKSSRPSSGDGFFSSPQVLPDSTLNQPANPAGALSGQFNNGIGGLPGSAGQSVVPAATTVPDWRPQPPPWMSQRPQPGVVPKRKF